MSPRLRIDAELLDDLPDMMEKIPHGRKFKSSRDGTRSKLAKSRSATLKRQRRKKSSQYA